MNKKLLLSLTGAVILLILSYFLFFNKSSSQAQTTYTYTTVSRGQVIKNVTGTGNIEGVRSYNLSFKSAGTVTDLNVKAGQQVNAGDVLAKIDDKALQQALTNAQSNAKQARNNYTSTKVLGGKSLTVYQLNNLWEKVKQADADVLSAQDNLSNATLKAPASGIITSVKIDTGDTVGSSAVITMIDNSKYFITSDINEVDSTGIRVGMIAQITFDSLSDVKYAGKVLEVSTNPTITSGVVTYPIKIELIGADSKIRLGMSATANIALDSRDNVLMVSNGAIKSTNGQKYVQIMQNGVLTPVNVKLGLVGDSTTEILEGLNEGDQVVRSSSTSSSTSGLQQQTSSIFSGATSVRRGG